MNESKSQQLHQEYLEYKATVEEMLRSDQISQAQYFILLGDRLREQWETLQSHLVETGKTTRKYSIAEWAELRKQAKARKAEAGNDTAADSTGPS